MAFQQRPMPRCFLIATVIAISTFVTLASALSGQTPDLTADRSAQIAATARLHPDQTIRLALPGQGRVTGATVIDSVGHLVFQPARGTSSVPLAGADTLWVRKRAWVPGMVVGGILGVGFGAFVIAVGSSLCDTQDCISAGQTIGALLVSGAVGAALGAGVGALIPKWKRSWVATP